ncbi:polyamine-modulated factor 1 [Xiphophorus couchianus]|uniref:polyamine-modulated factor 1 n=1 Tax=Xiphophorus couchianus TaxID=32473 RepID=UPI001015FF33|nr:polyamine-modulated factor 1-like [Xiphophorus couchianus]
MEGQGGSGQNEDEKQKESDSTGKRTDAAATVGEPGSKAAEETAARYNRLKLFDKVIQKSLNKFIEHASFKAFASTFCPLYKKNIKSMEEIHKHFTEMLQKSIQEDIMKLMEEGQFESKFNELDKLEIKAKDKPDPAWRPSGVPEQDICSFLMPYYMKQEAYMKLELKRIQAENAALAERVRAGREGIAQTEHRISTGVDEWKATVTEFERLASSLCPAHVFDE